MNGPKIRVSVVNYTNTIPFVWGLKNSGIINQIELQEDIPSICATKLERDEVDIALLPVAAIPTLSASHILSRYCIGACGAVDSVRMYSDVPPDEIRQVLLDYQSRTSVELVKVLFERLWKKRVSFEAGGPGFENHIGKHTGGVVIGDRTFGIRGRHPFEIDLASAWLELTGLPFVFAAWVSKSPLPGSFTRSFDEALELGLNHIPQAVHETGRVNGLSSEETIDYLKHKISFTLDEDKLRGMELFIRYLKEPAPAPLQVRE
jgi:chorismate dehydratase